MYIYLYRNASYILYTQQVFAFISIHRRRAAVSFFFFLSFSICSTSRLGSLDQSVYFAILVRDFTLCFVPRMSLYSNKRLCKCAGTWSVYARVSVCVTSCARERVYIDTVSLCIAMYEEYYFCFFFFLSAFHTTITNAHRMKSFPRARGKHSSSSETDFS